MCDSHCPLIFLKHDGSRIRVESKQVTTICKSDVALTIIPHTSTTHADTIRLSSREREGGREREGTSGDSGPCKLGRHYKPVLVLYLVYP